MFLECRVNERESKAGWTVSGQFRVLSDAIFYRLGRPIVNLYAWLMFNLDVLWEAPFPAGPKIIAPNHPSTTDPFLIVGLVPEPTSILILDKLFKVPVFGRYLKWAGHVPVARGNGQVAFGAARRALEDGRNVAVFPEGAVSPLEGGFHQPRTGVARLALSTGAPIVPIGIHLERERLRLVESRYAGISAIGTWYLSGPYAMTVGRPLHFEGDVEDREYIHAVSERVIQRIAQLSHQSARRVQGRRSIEPQLKTGPLGMPGQV